MRGYTRSFTVALLAALFAGGCYHETAFSHDDQLVCDGQGCLVCDDGTCFEYACDADSQCPLGYACTAAHRCAQISDPVLDPTERTVECDATGCYSCGDTETGRVCYAYTCGDAAPCPTGRVCEAGGCVLAAEPCATECCANAECPEGSICNADGACVSLATPECLTDEDCGPGARCREDLCVAVELPPRPEESCVLASDCGLDGTCIDGACHFACTAEGACPVTQRCEAELCLPQTSSPAECLTGADCAADGARCIDGTCRPTCEEDADCGLHERCEARRGLCEPDPRPLYQCLGNLDCGEGEDCVDGRCLLGCAQDRDCAFGEDCLSGYCAPVIECASAEDCAEGLRCVNGACE